MNANKIEVNGFSNPDSERLYKEAWPDEPKLRIQATEDCLQCGGCSFFAPFNSDWGLCCNKESRHHLESVFEHFSCASIAHEGWGAHSFSSNDQYFCRCERYTPLPAQTEIVCLCVNVSGLDGEKVRASLDANSQIFAEDPSLYFALNAIQAQVETALARSDPNS